MEKLVNWAHYTIFVISVKENCRTFAHEFKSITNIK